VRVLVVEDEARMAGLLQRALREEGHAVDVAADGPEGLAGDREQLRRDRLGRHAAWP